MKRCRRRVLAGSALLALAGLLIPAATLRWGLPTAYDVAPDALLPLRSLVSVAKFPWEAPPADKYPEAHHLIAGAAESLAARLWLHPSERAGLDELRNRLTARAGDPGFQAARALLEEGSRHAEALSTLIVAGRAVTLVFGFLLALAVADLAFRTIGPRGAPLAGGLLLLTPAVAHYAATLNVDVPGLAWLAVAWTAAIRAGSGSVSAALVCGIGCGLAAATKDPLIGALPGVVCLALLPGSRGGPAQPKAMALRRCGALAAGAVAAYGATSGLLQPSSWWQHVQFALGEGSQGYREFAFTPSGLLGLAQAIGRQSWIAAGPALVGLALCGLLFRRLRRRRTLVALLLPSVSYGLFFLLVVGYVYPRFTLPLLLPLAVAASAAGGGLARRVGRSRMRGRRLLAAGATGLVLLLPLPGAVAIDRAKRGDPRPSATAALAAARRTGDTVWIAPEAWFLAPFPMPAEPRRQVGAGDLLTMLSTAPERPAWILVSVGTSSPLASPELLSAALEPHGYALREWFEPASLPPLARGGDGLLLPCVALFRDVRR